MNRKNLLGSLVAAILLILMAVSMNAQDVNNPWHLTAKENGKEVAFYNVEAITDVKATTQTVTIILDNGKQFSHPIATTTFGFDPRKSGTGTANEMITTPQWNVSYANGRLNFSKPVSNVTVYSMMGTLVARNTGSYTSVPVNLNQGIYVVQAGDKTAKLPVSNSDFGGSLAIVHSKDEQQATAYAVPPVSLRAGSIKIYWNITTTHSVIPVEIPEVEKFYFTANNSMVFTLKDGNTIELADYKGIEFTVEPAVTTTTSKWDMEKTVKFGGASYGADYTPPYNDYRTCAVIAVSKNEVIADFIFLNSSVKISPKDITYVNFWNIANGRLACVYENSIGILTMSTEQIDKWGDKHITFYAPVNPFRGFDQDKDNKGYFGTLSAYYSLNKNTNVIPTTIKLNADDSLTMEFIDVVTGAVYSHTFPAPKG